MSCDEDLLDLAISLAHTAGDMALAGRKQGLSNVDTKSTATDMVTEFDKASEALITDGIRRARPSDGIIGEEGARQESASGITWHIDPIDGTTNFFFDLPTWAVSIAAVDDNGSLVGVVYIPALGETFTAIRGHGAFLNDQPIFVRKNPLLSDALVCTGFSYSAQKGCRKRSAFQSLLKRFAIFAVSELLQLICVSLRVVALMHILKKISCRGILLQVNSLQPKQVPSSLISPATLFILQRCLLVNPRYTAN